MKTKQSQLIEFLRKKGGFVEYPDLIKAGFYKAIIRETLKSGRIERISRGVYGLTEIPDMAYPDLVTACFIIPRGVVCLITALSFYEVTDEIPRYIDIAIPAQTREKEIQNLPIRYYHFSQKSWEAGIEEHNIDGYKVRVYSLAKTIADCFKFRNQIGMDVARASLKCAFLEKKVPHHEIMKYASICRVTNIIKPILETLL